MSTAPVRNKIAAIRSELVEVDDLHWGSPPDWEIVRSQLQSLIESGHPDAVIDLGDELIEAATKAIELFDQEGEVAEEIEPCLTVVFQAIEQSDLSPTEKLRRAIDLEFEDEYGLCEAGFDDFWRAKRTKVEWRALGTELQRLLERQQRRGTSKAVASGYQRDWLSTLLAEASRKAGRAKEATALLEREATATGDYRRILL